MKRSEAMVKYRDAIEKAMVECYRNVLWSYGTVQYDIYVWADGTIIPHETIQGSNSWVEPDDGEEMFCVCRVAMPNYDPWDSAIDGKPEDDEEAEREEKDIIDWEVSEYELILSDYYDEMIDRARFYESMERCDVEV